jgi:hypothetical protein
LTWCPSGFCCLRMLMGRTSFVLTLSYRASRKHRRRSGQAVVGDPPVDRLRHAFGVAMPGSDHIGGDTCRAHPGDIPAYMREVFERD